MNADKTKRTESLRKRTEEFIADDSEAEMTQPHPGEFPAYSEKEAAANVALDRGDSGVAMSAPDNREAEALALIVEYECAKGGRGDRLRAKVLELVALGLEAKKRHRIPSHGTALPECEDRPAAQPTSGDSAKAERLISEAEANCNIAKGTGGNRVISPLVDTRFAEFDDAGHPFQTWWQKHGQYMMAGGGNRERIWAARGWIAHEQFAAGVEVTGESINEKTVEELAKHIGQIADEAWAAGHKELSGKLHQLRREAANMFKKE